MSEIQPPIDRLRFYQSLATPCSYLAGRMERKVFTRLSHDSGALLSMLTRAGFRRSHDISYRPACEGCNACVPVRIDCALFAPSRTQAKCLRRNGDLAHAIVPLAATVEQYALFSAYQSARHGDGDMAMMNFDDYRAMIETATGLTELHEWRNGANCLKAVMLADRVADGISAVYSFFDPVDERRSLGIFMILELVRLMNRQTFAYVYPGYFIAGSRKMSYKANFAALERLGPDGWAPIEDPTVRT